MRKYKVTTEWTGYSVVVIEANSPQEAEEKYYCGEYLEQNEQRTGDGLDFGYDHENTLEVAEVTNEKAQV